ncbi:MAG TPA: hypothetical protein VIS49_07375 [Cyclobacteriaceae bacterium]
MSERIKVLLIFLLFASLPLCGQEVVVRGQFQVDSIKIGISFPYSLTATYPSKLSVVFPDSTFTFDPFEIDRKVYYTTETKNGLSKDSVVYHFLSFEIDSIQKLSLPIFILHANDCTTLLAKVDSVFLEHQVKQMPDSVAAKDLPLKTNTAYQKVIWLLNYPLLLIVAGVLIVSLIITWIIFGKRIRQYFILRKLNKYHNQFMHEYEVAVNELQSHYSITQAEATLALWKKYMEHLLATPFTKYTTKEIFQRVKDETLAGALRKIDWDIYGKGKGIEKDPLIQLQQFTDRKFNEKVQEVKNG